MNILWLVLAIWIIGFQMVVGYNIRNGEYSGMATPVFILIVLFQIVCWPSEAGAKLADLMRKRT